MDQNEPWKLLEFAEAINAGRPRPKTEEAWENNLRGWRLAGRLPKSPKIVSNILLALFGDDPDLAEWKRDLEDALQRDRQAKLEGVIKWQPEHASSILPTGEPKLPLDQSIGIEPELAVAPRHRKSFPWKRIFGILVRPQFVTWRDDLDASRQGSSKGKNVRTVEPPTPPQPGSINRDSESALEISEPTADTEPRSPWHQRLRHSYMRNPIAGTLALVLFLGIGLTTIRYIGTATSAKPEDATAAPINDRFIFPNEIGVTDTSLFDDSETQAEPTRLVLVSKDGKLHPVGNERIDPVIVQQFAKWVKPEFDRLTKGRSEPLLVVTTLDLELQQTAASSVRNHLPVGAEGALISLDRDGAVRAMMSGANASTNANRIISPVFAAGPAWRIFVYAAALNEGFTPFESVQDEPATFNGWSVPQRSYSGGTDLRNAFAYAMNSVTMQLAWGRFDAIEDLARRSGITTPISTEISMPLGAFDVRFLEMNQVFAMISSGGSLVKPFGVTKISTLDGEVIYTREAKRPEAVIPTYVADEMIDLLQTSVVLGPARFAAFGRPMAGLAGISSDSTSGWFFGFSSGITTAVWIGRPDGNKIDLKGGALPARAFGEFMRGATKGRPVEQFATKATLPDRLLAD
ncbi:transglycosylase domain-containing protein [Novosphingobium naphthalenivorans]|uniref:transglycosylase domain-containing protein n=1 Tax=Novosphingobium naphthalenivorans TaxID=273168 RepID=UPI0012EDF1DF|nr:penicillin-binding transpeptidase domain-containing protein [Novosphingobium naphthalenivorans]